MSGDVNEWRKVKNIRERSVGKEKAEIYTVVRIHIMRNMMRYVCKEEKEEAGRRDWRRVI